MAAPSILFVACDAYLAGIYGRKFELDGWDVHVYEEMLEGERKAARIRPTVMIVDTECVADIVEEVRRLRGMPTLLKTKIVILTQEASQKEIEESLQAGADDYLLLGHFVPQEMLTKMKKLVTK